MTTKNLELIHAQTSLSAISGFLLFNIRDQMGVNQRELAKIFDMTHVTYGSMERGETAINSDFIYMLCSMLGIKFSDYFALIEELVSHLTATTSCALSENIVVSIIPSSDILKIINSGYNHAEAFNNEREHNLILGQDFSFFLTQELRVKVLTLCQTRLTSEKIKELVNMKSENLNEIEQQLIQNENIQSQPLYATGAAAYSLGSFLGLNAASAVVGLVGMGGYELFKSYKKSKEEKKSKK